MEKIFKQKVNISLAEAWAFFSNPVNLDKLTPGDMNFKITSSDHERIYPGMIITYKVSPLLGINMNWMTEITHVQDRKYFIDNQKSGPFKIWHHQHHFKEIDGGIEMTDILHYKAPFGLIGRLAEKAFVNRRVNAIFEYRTKVLEEIFGKYTT